MKKSEAVLALIGAFGCMIFALFIVMAFFSAPAEGRISPLMAATLTISLMWAGIAGLYIGWRGLQQ